QFVRVRDGLHFHFRLAQYLPDARQIVRGFSRQDLRQLLALCLRELAQGGFLRVDSLLYPVVVSHDLRRGQGKVTRFGALEHSEQRVIVPGWNRIEFVIVTLSAGDGQAEKAASCGIDTIVLELRAERKEPQPGYKFLRLLAAQKVSGDL